jgi:RimJ/RimL family protein N-acetyltransferase
MIFDNHTLQSQRLIIREFEISDAEEFYKLNSDEEVIRYTGDSAFESVESARVFLSNYNEYEKNGYGRWAVIDKESKVYLGWCGLKYHKEGHTDIGFRFHKQYWGKGYATESAKAVIDYGFNTLGLSEIIGRASKENIASIRVLEKLGMEFWKRDTCEGIPNSVYYKIEN